jgi:CheY-like chemotaxis protein
VSPSILIVEDDAFSRDGLREFFQGNGYAVETCGDGLQGFRLVRSAPFDVALVDLDLPAVLGVPISGWDFIRMLRAYLPDLPVVVLTAQEHSRKLREDGAALRVTEILHKPVSPRRLKAVIGALAVPPRGAGHVSGSKTSRGVCRMAIKRILALMIVVVLVTGCAGLSAREKGALVGGSGGAAAGALFGAAAGNAALGAIIGGPVGLLGGYILGPKLFKSDAGRH